MTREEYIDFEFNRVAFCHSQSCSECPIKDGAYCAFSGRERSKKEMLESITEERFALIKNYRQSYVNWEEIPVDTPIYVRETRDEDWKPRHFAKYENGKVYSWYNGGTSFSENNTIGWTYAKLADK